MLVLLVVAVVVVVTNTTTTTVAAAAAAAAARIETFVQYVAVGWIDSTVVVLDHFSLYNDVVM